MLNVQVAKIDCQQEKSCTVLGAKVGGLNKKAFTLKWKNSKNEDLQHELYDMIRML